MVALPDLTPTRYHAAMRGPQVGNSLLTIRFFYSKQNAVTPAKILSLSQDLVSAPGKMSTRHSRLWLDGMFGKKVQCPQWRVPRYIIFHDQALNFGPPIQQHSDTVFKAGIE